LEEFVDLNVTVRTVDGYLKRLTYYSFKLHVSDLHMRQSQTIWR